MRDTNIIKVKTLSKKMAAQIQPAKLPDGKVGKQISAALMNGTLKPIAWAQGNMIAGVPNTGRAWLIEFLGELYWAAAPYGGKVSEGTPDWLARCAKDLPQVFIS